MDLFAIQRSHLEISAYRVQEIHKYLAVPISSAQSDWG